MNQESRTKRNSTSKILSQKGKEIIDRKVKEVGRPKDSEWWAIEAEKYLNETITSDIKRDGVSMTTWKRFVYAVQPIRSHTFDAFCRILDIDPALVTEVEATGSTLLLGDPPLASEFYGRKSLLQKLQKCISKKPRLLAVYGRAGIGKTALVRNFVHDFNTDYEYKIWFSVDFYPNFTELLSELAREVDLDTSNADSSWQNIFQEKLLPFLKKHKCLIILDDWYVATRDIGSSGIARLSYGDHEKFLELSCRNHKSCFIIISRNDPITFKLKQYSTEPLCVNELSFDDDREILEAEGLTGSESELRCFLSIYNTPLILSRTARKVRNINNGDVSILVGEGVTTVVDSETLDVLREDLSALTDSEKKIVFSLALWRSSVTYEQIREEFISLISMNQLINDLDSLAQKDILQSEEKAVYSLPPIILKAVTSFFVDEVSTGITETLNLGNTQSLNILSTNILIKDMKDEVLVTEIKRRVIRPIIQKLQPLYNSKKSSLLDDLRNLVSSVEQSDHSTGFTVRNLQLIIHEVEEM